jgi:RNA polymerase-binding transcription factor DksA
METIERTLQGELRQTIERLRGLGGAVVFEDYPGALEEGGQGDAGGDVVSEGEERERTLEARGRLVERVNRLAQAIERVRAGDYGICEMCGDPIAARRLLAIPEATTCVACQDAAERRATQVPERTAAR